jgi:hypothetical protein
LWSAFTLDAPVNGAYAPFGLGYGRFGADYVSVGAAYHVKRLQVLNNTVPIPDLMATTSNPDEVPSVPYTPAGDIDEVLTALDDVDVYTVADDTDDDDDPVLPVLDDALAELAAVVDAPTDTASDDDERPEGDAGGLARDRADFEEVAANTEVDSIPYENAAAFLANTLYAVPPANTRFEWADVDDPTPDWDLDVDR